MLVSSGFFIISLGIVGFIYIGSKYEVTRVFKYLKILTVGRFEINYLQAQNSKIKCLNTRLKVLRVLT